MSQAAAAGAAQRHEPSCKDGQPKLVLAGQPRWMAVLAVQDAELLSKQQAFEVLLLVGASHDGKHVE